MFPVVAELRRCGESPTIIATGQHTDLLRGTPFEDGMAPDIDMGLRGSNDPMAYAKACGDMLGPILDQIKPDTVIVQGDTASAYAGAMAAGRMEAVVHIEAGIRSGDTSDPWPEENFRMAIDKISKWKFAPTIFCGNMLRLDGLRDYHTHVTGNTGIDALYSHTKPVEHPHEDRVLITLHRRESFGEPLAAIVRGIAQAAAQYQNLAFIWPMHPNPHVQEALSGIGPDVVVTRPMDTLMFANILANSRAVITDSGGVQEEAAALGIPCVVARERTDRPESVELGLARIGGRTEAGILERLAWGLDTQIEPSHCFGDGAAAPRIVSHLLG